MKTFPIMLNVQGRLAVVVGGGAVGLRKVRALRAAGAAVRLAAQRLAKTNDLQDVEIVLGPYRPEVLAGAALVFACTDDAELNAAIAADARKIGALVNAADQPEDCDFFLPAVVADGPVVVAVGTGGASPALAARLKGLLAGALPPRIGEFADLLDRLRGQVKARVADPARRAEVLKRLAEEDVHDAFLAGGAKAVEDILAQWLARNAT